MKIFERATATNLTRVDVLLTSGADKRIMEIEACAQPRSSEAVLATVERHHRKWNLLHDDRVFSLPPEHVLAPSAGEARLAVGEIVLCWKANHVDMLVDLNGPIEDQERLEGNF